MMKSLLRKKYLIFIVVFVIFAFFFASLSFNQKVISSKKSDKLEEGEVSNGIEKVKCSNIVKENYNFYDRYHVTATFSSDGSMTLSIDPSTSGADSVGENFELYVDKISIVSVDNESEEVIGDKEDNVTEKVRQYTEYSSKSYSPDNYKLSHNHPITISKDEVLPLADGFVDADTVLIRLKATKANSDPLCKGTVFFDTEANLDSFSSSISLDIEGVEPVEDYVVPATTVDCSNPKSDFEKSYCTGEVGYFNPGTGKTTAVEDHSSELNGGTFKNRRIALKCDAHAIVPSSSAVITDSASESKYYVNDKILKATHKTTESFENYSYKYAPGIKEVTVPVKVDTTCTETVHVQYGPPVSAKAGFCFEYNVKVTSTVVCQASKVPAPKTSKYCTPTPKCYHKVGDWTGANAGPSDDFDTCIRQCDGGKYSDYCSQKCYISVYGSGNKKTSNFYNDYTASKVASNVNSNSTLDDEIAKCVQLEKNSNLKYSHFTIVNYPNTGSKMGNVNFYGCYYKAKDGSIQWYSGNTGTIKSDSEGGRETARFAPGRWYGINRSSYNYVNFSSKDGFFRKAFKNNLCTADCRWDGCSETEYWNPAQAKADYDANKAVFDKAKAAAEKASTCSVKTTEFTMKVTEYGSYMKSIDTLTSNASGYSVSDQEKLLGKHYIRDYAGCYKNSNINNHEMYQTTWGFPGSWIDNKSSKVSFVEITDSTPVPKKFCLPLDAKPVNEKWWTYYYTSQYEHSTTSLTSQVYQDNCMKTTACTNWVHENDIDWNNDITYNITGSTNNFGHFGWNLDVSCFYAYATNPTTTTEKECKPSVECDSSSGYTVRSVDLGDLFPSQNGDTHSSDTSGRDTGFNWSQYALNIKKDSNYPSDPVSYMKWVQSNEIALRKQGKSTYTNESELDYRIYLTREDLRNIKNYVTSDSFSYTDYGSRGKFLDNKKSSVVSYQSNMLRSGTINGLSLSASNNVLPGVDLLPCNNISNGSCTKYASEGEK